YDSDGSTATQVFSVDTLPPNVTERRPTGVTFTRSPTLQLKYRDVSAVDVDNVQVRLDGAPVNGTAGQHWFNASLDSLSEGVHTFSYNVPDEHWQGFNGHNASGSWNITLPVNPVLSGTGPTGITDSDVTLTVEAADPSPIDTSASYLTVEGPEERRIDWEDRAGDVTATDRGAAFSTTVDGLDDGVYTVTAHVEDANGNTAEQQWNFTVDTTPPELSISSHVAGDIVTGEETVSINVSDLTAVDTVNVTVENRTVTATQDGSLYTASIDTTRLADGKTTLSVNAVDAAGNQGRGNLGVVVDNTPPEITGLDLYPAPAKGGIVISATARDAATRIIGARYRIEGSDDRPVTDGRMDAIRGEFDSSEEEIRTVIDLQSLNLSSGNYTAFLMTRDAAGHDFDGFGTAFQIDNSLNASLAVEDAVFQQEIGTERTFTVPVTNTGAVDEMVRPRVETGLDTSITPDRRRIDTGETKQFELTVSLPDNDSLLGNHSVTLVADGLSTTARRTAEVVAQPHPAEREEIRASLQALEEELAELNESRQEWGLSSDAAEQFEETAERVNTVRRLLEEGRYRAAQQELSAARETLDRTQSTISGEITRARLGSVATVAAKLVAMLALVALVYGGYRLIPEEEGYHPERGYVHRPEGKHPVRLQVEAWWEQLRPEQTETVGDRREKTVERWQGYED
ncbi:MAG: Ig-like domain-containing protein, partial [Candidatus Nanohaloarchaea archaeon]